MGGLFDVNRALFIINGVLVLLIRFAFYGFEQKQTLKEEFVQYLIKLYEKIYIYKLNFYS